MIDRVRGMLVDEMSARGYMPLKDENGNVVKLEYADILQKQSWGATFIVELADGDYFSAGEIGARMERSFNAIKSIGGIYPVVFIEAFIFAGSVPEDKLDMIKSVQEELKYDKRYLVSFSIQLDKREVISYSNPPVGLDGLEKIFQRVVSSEPDVPVRQEEAEVLNDTGVEEAKRTEPVIQLSDKKPVVSYALLAANILMWLLTAYYGYRNNVNANLLFGAKFNPLIMRGEYWRLLTPVFLHGGIVHLLVNSYSLYAVGPTVEKLFGRGKFAAIYFAAGIMGNIASFIFSIHPSVGASGALFGLMGALLYTGQKHRTLFKNSFGRNVVTVILFNIVYGFSQPGIDNFAHLGGLAGGYLAALGVGLLWEKGINRTRLLAWSAILILAVGGIYAGFHVPANIELNKAYDLYMKSH